MRWLLQFCAENELVVTNTWFQHKDIHKFTWECTGNNQRSIIDYGTCHNKVSHQHWASETNGYGRTTNLERASDKTGTDHTTAVGSCRECWRIPANDTYVQVKSNESAYKGVKLSIPLLLNNK